MNGHAIREAARAIAMVTHDGISRKGAGEPYFNHVERVAEAVWGWRAKSLAYLHDTIEDHPQPTQMEAALRAIFFQVPLLVDEVRFLSRLPHPTTGVKPSYDEFIDRIILSGVQDVMRVKLADVEDNLRDIEDIPGAQHHKIRYLKAQARLTEALAS